MITLAMGFSLYLLAKQGLICEGAPVLLLLTAVLDTGVLICIFAKEK